MANVLEKGYRPDGWPGMSYSTARGPSVARCQTRRNHNGEIVVPTHLTSRSSRLITSLEQSPLLKGIEAIIEAHDKAADEKYNEYYGVCFRASQENFTLRKIIKKRDKHIRKLRKLIGYILRRK